MHGTCSDASLALLVLTFSQGITPEALEELEATEAWVETMAMCEEMEREHLIMFALE